MWLCPVCESAIEDDKEYCIVCGSYKGEVIGSVQFCIHCGAKYIVDQETRYCINCGHLLRE